MNTKNKGHITVTLAALGAGTMLLSGCLAGPTYGTGTPSNVQLVDDLASAITIRPQQGADIEYTPRTGIVEPPEGTAEALPPPQTAVASSEQWPESPEELRARLRAEADANQGNPNYRSPLLPPRTGDGPVLTAAATADRPETAADVGARRTGLLATGDRDATARFRQARAVQNASSPSRRAFLSEPPVTYRQPAATAPVGELGESERAKERRRLEAAEEAKNSGSRWWPF